MIIKKLLSLIKHFFKLNKNLVNGVIIGDALGNVVLSERLVS